MIYHVICHGIFLVICHAICHVIFLPGYAFPAGILLGSLLLTLLVLLVLVLELIERPNQLFERPARWGGLQFMNSNTNFLIVKISKQKMRGSWYGPISLELLCGNLNKDLVQASNKS